MTLELAELEAPLSRFGSLIAAGASAVLTIMGLLFFTVLDEVVLLNYVMLLIVGAIIMVTSFLAFASPWIQYKINFSWYSMLALILFVLSILIVPRGTIIQNGAYWAIGIGIIGIVVIFIDKRPNLGPEGNKHLYQAYGGILAFSMGLLMLVLGIFILIFNIADFAGAGTIPGNFYHDYIQGLGNYNEGITIYNAIRGAGIIVIIGSIIVIFLAILRNKVGLKLAGLIIFAGVIITAGGLGSFSINWSILDQLFFTFRPDEYETQLRLTDPGIFNLGFILFLLEFGSFLMIIYSSLQSKPIEKWRTKRNHFLAAAEVATREQKLSRAIKYLEQAAAWSSRLGEEDKAVELLTRVKQIRDKVIKMKKAEAAEKRKKDLEAAKAKAE
jgi:hypothetical protein